MGEELVEKKEEKTKEEEAEKKKEEEVEEEVVLKVDMHCGACARKVARSLRKFKGVKEVVTDCKASKVVVKGKELDAIKLSERIQKKTGRKVEVVSHVPKPPEPKPEPKLEPEPEEKQQAQPPKEEKKDEAPPVTTIMLKMSMHCEACAQGLQRRIRKIPGVESVTTDLESEQVAVTGVLEADKLINDVFKKTRKQAFIVAKPEEEKKKEEKKEEEKKEEAQEEKKDDDDDDIDIETKKIEHWSPMYYMDSSYAPQMFSDENPNACFVM